MTDWLYESSNAQARYEEAQRQVENLEKKLKIYLDALYRIGNDYVELSHDKIRWQRDDHMKTAKKAITEVTK